VAFTKSFILFIGLAFFACACSSDEEEGEPCNSVINAIGLSIEIRDSESNEFIDAGIIVTAKDGAHRERMSLLTNSEDSTRIYGGAYDSPGTYRILVSGKGYENFVSPEIMVVLREDGCHVKNERRTYTIKRF